MREFYRLLSSPLLSASTNHSLKSRDSVDFTTATDISAKRSAVATLLLFVIRLINANSWSGWGISKSQPLASKASRLPLTLHPDILVPGVGNDPTSVPYQDTANPSQLTRQNSLRNTRRSIESFQSTNFCSHSALSAVNSFHTLLDRLCLSFVIFR